MGGDVHNIACPICNKVTQYELGGDAYSPGYGFQGFACQCPRDEHKKCKRILNADDSVERVSIRHGLPVYHMKNGQVIRSRMIYMGGDQYDTVFYFEDSVLNVKPPCTDY